MAHHSSEPFFGATGKFPQGKLNETDEGELQLGIAADIENGKVLVNFGKPVAWIGFDYEQAMALSASLRDNAFLLRGITP